MIPRARNRAGATAVLVLGSVLLVGCSNPSLPPATAPETAPSSSPASSPTVTSEAPATSKPAVVVTLPPGEAPEHGDESVRQELSAPCAEAVEPIRKLMSVYANGLLLESPHDEVLSRQLGEASAACPEDEWVKFYTEELDAWLTP